MTAYVCRYPDGVPGVALLLLRCGCALAVVAIALLLPPMQRGVTVLYPAAGVVSLALLLGLATRVAATLLAALIVAALLTSAQPLLLAGQLGACAALALLGPGAFSIDARLHGRRVIHLQSHHPERGDAE